MVKKAVILAAGSASRMQKGIERYVKNREELSAIRKGEKMAVRFSKNPFLDYQILNLIEAGVKSITIVLSPEDTFFKDHYSKQGGILFPEADITFSFQSIPDGTAHAVLAAEKFVGGEMFLVLNGDNNYPSDSVKMLVDSPLDYAAMVAFDIDGFNEWTRSRLKVFAMIKTEDGKLTEIIEKPDNPMAYSTDDLLYSENNRRVTVTNKNLTSMNLWRFDGDIIEACRDVPRHPPRKERKAGEYELPDAVGLMMDRGKEVLVYYTCTDVLDLTRAEDIEFVEKAIKESLEQSIRELERRYAGL